MMSARLNEGKDKIKGGEGEFYGPEGFDRVVLQGRGGNCCGVDKQATVGVLLLTSRRQPGLGWKELFFVLYMRTIAELQNRLFSLQERKSEPNTPGPRSIHRSPGWGWLGTDLDLRSCLEILNLGVRVRRFHEL